MLSKLLFILWLIVIGASIYALAFNVREVYLETVENCHGQSR